MEKKNVLLLITPKTELAYLQDDMNVRQAIEKMKAHGYMAIPVITKDGEYAGTLSEGDLLWTLVNKGSNVEELENIKVKTIVRKDYTPPVKVDAGIEELINLITEQNFVPVIDDRNILMGIVTRKRVIKSLLQNEA